MLKARQPVLVTGAHIHGPLRLPRAVRTPLVLRGSYFDGRFDASETHFSGLVDLSGDHFRAPVDFSATRFDGPFVFRQSTAVGDARFGFARFSDEAIFSGARFAGPTSFTNAAFDGPARFRAATFGAPASKRPRRRADGDGAQFSFVSFARSVDFVGALFNGPVSFTGAELQADADFAGAQLYGMSHFDGTRFSRPPDFVNTEFGPVEPKQARLVRCANGIRVWTTFCSARFDAGAHFVGALFLGVSFAAAEAGGDLDFSAAQFRSAHACATGEADFSTTTFFGDAKFTNADFGCLASFDQARIDELDLGDAQLKTLWFPRQRDPATPEQLGRIGVLRLNVDDVRKIQPPGSADPRARRRDLEGVLQLVEDGARAAGDLRTANEARVRRLSLDRESKSFWPRMFDWAVWWGLLGYLVRPSHQALAIAIVVLVGLCFRLLAAGRATADVSAHRVRDAAEGPRRRVRRPFGVTAARRRIGVGLRELRDAFQDLLGVLFRLRPPAGGGVRVLEYLSLKFLIVVLAINVGDVWPPFRAVIEGVF